MRTRLAPLAWLLVLGSAGFVMLSLTRGQEGPSAAHEVTPTKPLPIALPRRVPDVGRKPGHDLSKLTDLQRQLYQSAAAGARWLSLQSTTKGRFIPGVVTALGAPLENDYPLRQAGAAFALARAARYFGDANQAARATQAILALLEDTALDKSQVRRPTLSPQVAHPLGLAALVVLAINELPAPGDDLLTASEQLCNYVRSQERPNGSIDSGEAGPDPEAASYPGLALYALMRSQERRPAAWKTALVRKALPFYLAGWRQHKERDSVCWLTAACAEAFLRTHDKAFAEMAFEMNDWLCGLQYERLDPRHPRWWGGFTSWAADKPAGDPPDVWSALCASSLTEACRITRQLPDVHRDERYTEALGMCHRFLLTLQFSEADTQHFVGWYRQRLVGGFHGSHQDGNLRLDYTQHAVAALVQYLLSVAPAP